MCACVCANEWRSGRKKAKKEDHTRTREKKAVKRENMKSDLNYMREGVANKETRKARFFTDKEHTHTHTHTY